MFTHLRLIPVLAALLLLLVAGCARGPQPTPGPLFSAIQRDAYDARQPNEVSFGPALERAVFTQFQGMTRAQAMSQLQADGFSCVRITCRFANVDRYSGLVATTLSNAQGAFAIHQIWDISFPGDPLNDMGDVQVVVSAQNVRGR